MLKHVPALVPPDLLHSLALMGHGDQLAVVDAHYPAASRHDRVHTMVGVTTVEAVQAIAALMPLDAFVEPAAYRMVPDGDLAFRSRAQDEVEAELARQESRPIRVDPLERIAFYAAAREAFAVAHTSDPRPFSCFLLTKGVLPGA